MILSFGRLRQSNYTQTTCILGRLRQSNTTNAPAKRARMAFCRCSMGLLSMFDVLVDVLVHTWFVRQTSYHDSQRMLRITAHESQDSVQLSVLNPLRCYGRSKHSQTHSPSIAYPPPTASKLLQASNCCKQATAAVNPNKQSIFRLTIVNAITGLLEET